MFVQWLRESFRRKIGKSFECNYNLDRFNGIIYANEFKTFRIYSHTANVQHRYEKWDIARIWSIFFAGFSCKMYATKTMLAWHLSFYTMASNGVNYMCTLHLQCIAHRTNSRTLFVWKPLDSFKATLEIANERYSKQRAYKACWWQWQVEIYALQCSIVGVNTNWVCHLKTKCFHARRAKMRELSKRDTKITPTKTRS